MLFSTKIPSTQKKQQKNRVCKKFRFFKNNKNYLRLKSLNYNRLFLNNIKLIDAFLRKCTSKFRRQSRKEYYKKLKEKNNRKKYKIKLHKKLIKWFSTRSLYKKRWYLNKIKKTTFKKYRRYHNTYLCFNHFKIPFSRKSLKSRMGKGNGNIKNWFLKFTAGKTIFYLKRWNSNYIIFALRQVKKYIPGETIAILPYVKKLKSNNTTTMFSI